MYRGAIFWRSASHIWRAGYVFSLPCRKLRYWPLHSCEWLECDYLIYMMSDSFFYTNCFLQTGDMLKSIAVWSWNPVEQGDSKHWKSRVQKPNLDSRFQNAMANEPAKNSISSTQVSRDNETNVLFWSVTQQFDLNLLLVSL